MRSPALAIAWEFRRRHRWGLVAVAAYLVILGIIKPILGPDRAVRLDPPNGMGGVLLVLFTATFLYFLAVFSFGVTGDLAARQSMYPARMFTLPVKSAALAGWPMVYGAAAMFGLWLTTVALARWPWGMELPWIWPALLAAAFLAWTQVLTWMPFGLRGLRVAAAVLWLPALDAVVLTAVHYKVPEPLMVAFLAPQLPLAYLAAWYAVARARRGEVPDWSVAVPVLARTRERFASPARAQVWFEWQEHGRALPVWVGILVPFELALLFVTRNDTPVFVVTALVLALLTPPFMASFAASHRLTPFTTTRPLSTAALIAAKLTMTIWSTLAAWLLVLVAIPLALTLSNTWPVVLERARRLAEMLGPPRAMVIALLVVAGLMVWTWKRLVQSLCIGLTGREWILKARVFLTLAFLVILGFIVPWVLDDRGVQVALWEALPLIAAVLISFKIAAGFRIVSRLHSSRLLSDRTLIIGAACWSIAVLALYGLVAWFHNTPLIPRYLFGLLAIVAMPLVRLSAAPLALAWNRHR